MKRTRSFGRFAALTWVTARILRFAEDRVEKSGVSPGGDDQTGAGLARGSLQKEYLT